MVDYLMDGLDFIAEFKSGGRRDEYYRKRFGHAMPLPVNKISRREDDGEVIRGLQELGVLEIRRTHEGYTVRLCDDIGMKLKKIPEAVRELQLKYALA